MENNKYYTPVKEDLCMGLEVEIKSYVIGTKSNDSIEIWKPVTIDLDRLCLLCSTLNEKILFIQDIRIKELNTEDILSLGFIEEEKRDLIHSFVYNKQYILYVTTKLIVIQYNNSVLFQGNLKNKSELKTILKWLNIIHQQ